MNACKIFCQHIADIRGGTAYELVQRTLKENKRIVMRRGMREREHRIEEKQGRETETKKGREINHTPIRESLIGRPPCHHGSHQPSQKGSTVEEHVKGVRDEP